jgi:hypothetical protein
MQDHDVKAQTLQEARDSLARRFLVTMHHEDASGRR